MGKKLLLTLLIIFFCIAWSNDPNVNTPVCTAQNSQKYPRIAADGANGAIITWQDNRAGHYDIYIQHLDATGSPQLPGNGLALCSANGIQEYPQIVTDGSGGAIVTWQDIRSGGHYDIYAQRINAVGNVLWTAGGVGICTVGGNQKNPRLIPDGAGGAIIVWQDKRNGSHFDIYAQRINPAGNALWTVGGTPICRAGNDQHEHQLIADGHGGAIITWTDGRGSSDDIYAQRINTAGSVQWATDGVEVCSAAYGQYSPQIIAKGSGGAIIAWFDKRNSYTCAIYAQRLNASGAAVWDADGILVESEYSYEPEDLCMIPDSQGGAIISWTDYNCPSQVWVEMERINGSGHSLWHAYVTSYDEGYNARMIPDGNGGAIITWSDDRHGTNGNIRAQHMNNQGLRQWGNYGVAICSRPGQQFAPQIAAKDGGAIITWYDEDIYAQNLCDTGGLGGCIAPIAVMNRLRYGGIVPADIEFDGSGSFDPDGTVVEWSWKFGDGKTGAQEKLIHTYPQVGLYWVTLRVKDNNDRWSAQTKAVVKTYALDNLEAKLSLTAQQVKANGKGRVQVNSGCYEKDTDPDREERPVPVDLGLQYTTTSGTWIDDMIFGAGLYSRDLLSGTPGTATIKAVLQGTVLGTIKVEFTWPRPPVNLNVVLKENRSLLRGEYFAYLTWSANPKEIFQADKYRIYRSTDGGSFEFAGEVDAAALTYVDKHLQVGSQYNYALSMVDSEGDESNLSTTVSTRLTGKALAPNSNTKVKQSVKNK